MAVTEPPSTALTEKLEQSLGMGVTFCFVPEDSLAQARSRAYRRLMLEETLSPTKQRLGERLVAAGRISKEQLRAALDEQVRTGERLGSS